MHVAYFDQCDDGMSHEQSSGKHCAENTEKERHFGPQDS